MSIQSLDYTITKFDEENKILIVTFVDGGWAQINLAVPFPQTMEDIDTIVKQFAAPIEVMEAKQVTVDLSFLHSQVGTSRTTSRYSLQKVHQLSATNSPVNDLTEVVAAEESRLREFVLAVLTEKGL